MVGNSVLAEGIPSGQFAVPSFFLFDAWKNAVHEALSC